MTRSDLTVELLIPIELLPECYAKEQLLKLAVVSTIQVYVVARTGWANDWSAYIGYPLRTILPHEYDMLTFPDGVASNGDKLDREVAETLFPIFKHLSYRG